MEWQLTVRGIAFDLDGVLINSIPLMEAAFQHSYKEWVGEGEPPFAEYCTHMGQRLEDILRLMGLPVEMAVLYKKFCLQNEEMVEIFPGVLSLLDRLQKAGVPMAICTGKDRFRTLRILERLGIAPYIQCVITSDDVVHAKPDPESLHAVGEKMKLRPEQMIMVGDAPYDVICGREAGAKTIGVTWGFTSEEELRNSRPDLLVESMDELLRVLLDHTTAPPGHVSQVR